KSTNTPTRRRRPGIRRVGASQSAPCCESIGLGPGAGSTGSLAERPVRVPNLQRRIGAYRSVSGTASRSAAELDLDVVADDTHREGLDIAGDRRPQAFAGLHLETAAVERALYDVAVEPAIGQEGEGVGT